MSERRDIRARAAFVQRVIRTIVEDPGIALTTASMQSAFGVSADTAERILRRLASSGTIRRSQPGQWVTANLPGLHGSY